MSKNNNPMTQNFIDIHLGNNTDFGLFELTEDQYDILYITKEYSTKAYKTKYFDDFVFPPHPLLTVHILSDYQQSFESGSMSWDFQLIFKYKKKFYHLVDCGET